MISYIISFIQKYKSQILFSSVIVANIVSGKIIINGIINSIYVCYLYKNNRNDLNYISMFSTIYSNTLNRLSDFLNNSINNILQIKIYFLSFINKNKNKKFILKNALFYLDLKTAHNVFNYFKFNNVTVLNDQLLDNILSYYKIPVYYSTNNRLKLFFTYDGKEYILYHSYNGNNIPYPPYTDEIINKYRSDIILPYYSEKKKDKSLYSLFSMSSKDISVVKINGVHSDKIKNYLLSIQTPFYDFGMLYCMPVKLEWIVAENNITDFNTLYILFLNLYFDEENMDLKDHEIFMTKDDVRKSICSEIMTDFLKKM